MQNEYIFLPSAYSFDLEMELAQALQARSELLARRQNPKLWTTLSAEPAANAPDEDLQKRRQLFEKLISILLAAAGAVLLALGVTKGSRPLTTPGLILLILAAARLMPGTGGGGGRRFQKSAHMLLGSLTALNLSASPKLKFTQDGLTIESNQKTADYAYERMEALVETPELFLLTHSGSATVLQKKDLILGTSEEFLDYFCAHAACPCARLTQCGVEA